MPGNCAKIPKASIRAYSQHREGSMRTPDHSSLGGVQRRQHPLPVHITSCSQGDHCAKSKRGDQPERCKLPSHCWCQCRPQVWYLSDGGSTAEGTRNSLKSSTPHARWEWDKELTFTLMCMFKRHSWGLFCCLYNLILKRFLCVTKSDLHVCWRGYYIPWYY